MKTNKVDLGPDDDPFASSARVRLRNIRGTSEIFQRFASWSKDDGGGSAATPKPGDGRGQQRHPPVAGGGGSPLVVRPLLPGEVETLTSSRCRCRCTDWSLVRLCYHVNEGDDDGGDLRDVSDLVVEQVSNTRFGGVVLLGVVLPSSDNQVGRRRRRRDSPGARPARSESGPSLPPVGVHDNALVKDCVLEPGCRVYKNTVLERTHVHTGASVLNCGTVSRTVLNSNSAATEEEGDCGDECKSGVEEKYPDFATGLVVNVGPESGGERSVPCHPESTIVDAAVALGVSLSNSNRASHDHRRDNEDEEDSSPKIMSSKLAESCPLNILCPDSHLSNCSSVCDVYLSSHTIVDSSPRISKITLLPNSSIESGAIVSNSILQWNVHVTDSANVSDSIIMEASAAGVHSRVSSSVVGPDCHLEGGEVQCSLLGPHVNAHHQSLVIAVVWLTGRGNVGYGANVGSNHTGRTADQECWAGEGVFWGLSTCIKFPVDLTRSPYSIIAAGVTLPPNQRLCMPFSLVIEDDGGGEGGGKSNQIMPGWVLHHSAYTVARAEVKYASRNRAVRHGHRYARWDVMRPGIVDLCLEARDALLSSSGDGDGRAVPPAGIGRCALTERARKDGVRAYTDAVRRYALRGLLDRLLSSGPQGLGPVAGGERASTSGGRCARLLEGVSRSDTSGFADRERSDDSSRCAAPRRSSKDPGPNVVQVSSPILPWEEASHGDAEALWTHQRAVLVSEFGGTPQTFPTSTSPPSSSPPPPLESVESVVSFLRELVDLERRHADRVFQSKSKDDVRGERVIPRYSECRVPAGDDDVVRSAREDAARVESAVDTLLTTMTSGGGGRDNWDIPPLQISRL